MLLAFFEPAFNRRILAVHNLPHSKEIAGKRRSRRSFDHLLEAAARNDFGVNVDPVFNQDAEDAFVIAIARQAPADSVCLDDPQTERFAMPDRFGRQAPHQYDRE
jgi:hypothetical protein